MNLIENILSLIPPGFVFGTAMALKAPQLEICQKCAAQWYNTQLLEI
jgi:hypothetical protein